MRRIIKKLFIPSFFLFLKLPLYFLRLFRLPPSNKILIIHLSFIGDSIIATPAISLLKNNMPQKKIHVFLNKNSFPVFQNNPFVDKVFADPSPNTKFNTLKHFITKIITNLPVIAELWVQNYDYIIDFTGSFNSAFIATLCCGKKNIGMSTVFFMNWAYDAFLPVNYSHALIVPDFYLEILKLIGIHYTDTDKHYQLFPASIDKKKSEELLRSSQGYKITLAPFAGWTSKEWPIARFALLCNLLAKLPATIFILGAPSDEKKIIQNFSEQDASIRSCVGKMTVIESAAVIAQSDLFIGLDSAMSYVAAAFEIPSLLIFGSTNPELHWKNKPGLLSILYKKIACSCPHGQLYCGDNTITYQCPFQNKCMNAITVDEVFIAARYLLETNKKLIA